ncbi:hypothetical protein J6590_015227 [Homalodisca vitripennis]|nr:hypothetical protein J6590_015227 [Homalodisca vitripennis]
MNLGPFTRASTPALIENDCTQVSLNKNGPRVNEGRTRKVRGKNWHGHKQPRAAVNHRLVKDDNSSTIGIPVTAGDGVERQAPVKLLIWKRSLVRHSRAGTSVCPGSSSSCLLSYIPWREHGNMVVREETDLQERGALRVHPRRFENNPKTGIELVSGFKNIRKL